MAAPRNPLERLFEDFAAPLVLGGPVSPRRFLSGKLALDIGDREPADATRFFDFQEARLRTLRKLLPLERVPNPNGNEWALVAAMHDLVLLLHPDFQGALRSPMRQRVLKSVLATASQVPLAKTLGEALMRHSFFANLCDLSRNDKRVSWWTGSKTFEGREPDARLLAWPKLRRVDIVTRARPIEKLVLARSYADSDSRKSFTMGSAMNELLQRSPLTAILHAGLFAEFAFTDELVSWLELAPARQVLLRALRVDPHAQIRVEAMKRAAKSLPNPVVAQFLEAHAEELRAYGSTPQGFSAPDL